MKTTRPRQCNSFCRAAFAHNKSNVISASMASYLLRHKSRFYFSHEFVYCPLTDLVRLHNKQDVCGSVNVTRDGNFFENLALHYLCRPQNLENLGPKEFFEKYEVKFVPPANRQCKNNPVVPFQHDTGHFQHPSAKTITRGKEKGKTRCRQGVQLRESECYAKVSQWAWPDTAHFNKSILECSDSEVNRTMDTYAQLALTLLVPHRCSKDLRDLSHTDFQYTHKLRKIFYDDKAISATGGEPLLFKNCNTDFLQNIQNCRHNCLRYKVSSDELACSTDAFRNPDCALETHADESDSEEDDEENLGYEEFLQELEDEFERPVHDDDPDYLFSTLKNFSFQRIRESGDKKCGYREDIKLPKSDFPEFDFVAVTGGGNADVRGRKRKKPEAEECKRTYSVKEINQVLIRKSTKSHQNVWKGKDIEVSDATGSIESIREWSKAGFGTDRKQQRAFEAIFASFILTFYENDKEQELSEATTEDHLRFRRSKVALLKLKGRTKDSQLICLLHGPGGSGKSTVINMVKAYAKSYCDALGHEFTCRTIVITAMSGVAATLINGETTHSCLGLNRKITTTHQAEFQDTRLVIIDEISFASVEDIDNIYQKLKLLMNKDYRPYGGVNIVFAGDYSQLEPVRKPNKVYDCKDGHPTFHGMLNCYIELNGQHRFKDDPEWGHRLRRFREGKPTRNDIQVINDSCFVEYKEPTEIMQVATRLNRNRDAINTAIYEDWCEENRPADGSILKNACVVLMDELEMCNSSKAYVDVTSNSIKRLFYESCGEDDLKLPKSNRGRVDPMLKLYPNCPMMLTENSNVRNGEANGSRVFVKQIRMKVGEECSQLKLDCGTTVLAVLASQVDAIVVEHENSDILPRQFTVEAKKWTFDCKLEIADEAKKVGMKGVQFPIISNSATTGHKLQGCSLDKVLVNDWYYQSNWAYVVLSRVRKMSGLYMREKLSFKLEKYAMCKKMKSMLERFRRDKLLEDMSERDYDILISSCQLSSTTSLE